MPRGFDRDDDLYDAPGSFDPQLLRARRVVRYLLATRALSPREGEAAGSDAAAAGTDADQREGPGR